MVKTEWQHPETLSEALAALAAGDALAVAGGTTVLDLLKLGLPLSGRLVDLSRLGLAEMQDLPGGMLQIGAMMSNSAVAQSGLVRDGFPALSQAILLGASQQIRNMASIGGNLMQATRCGYFRMADQPCNRRLPGSGCPALAAPMPGHAILGTSAACIATHPSDMAVALLALDAVVHWQSQGGSDRLPIEDFYRLPEASPEQQTRLPAGALITAISLPHGAVARNSGYLKLRGRASYEFASASVAAGLQLRAGRVAAVALALGGVGTIPWRDRQAEAALIGTPLTAAAIDGFADRLLAGAELRAATGFKADLARGAIHHMFERLAQ